jgi:cholesterol transport system auxiliary component
MKTCLTWLASIFLLVLLSSCGPVKAPAIANYTLAEIHPHTGSVHGKTPYVLLVTMPMATSGYDTSKMVYVIDPYQLRSFALNQWVAPPAQLLMPIFAQKLRETGYFKVVVTTPFVGVSQFRLDTQLLVLQQEFTGVSSHVRLVVQASVMNCASNQVVANRRFQALVDAPQNNPYGGVLAANLAADQVSGQIAAFVIRSVESH